MYFKTAWSLWIFVNLLVNLSTEPEEDANESESEVQITAAVMDITGDDSDIEEAVARDADDYSSYELDDSDEVLGK